MFRLGAAAQNATAFSAGDISLLRLQLLVLMAQALLEDCPFGEHRRGAAIRNAETVAADFDQWKAFGLRHSAARPVEMDHIFHQRVRLLAVMIKSASQRNPLGPHRRAAIKNNIDYLSETLRFSLPKDATALLKVA